MAIDRKCEAAITADDQIRAVADVLAAGLLRLRERNRGIGDLAAGATDEIPSKSSRNCLEVPGETVLSEHTG